MCMKAIVYQKYGNPSVLNLQEIAKPIIKSDEILIQIKATAVNSADIRLQRADPFLIRLMFGLIVPKKQILGIVYSGIVVEIGNNVKNFKIGDEVFGINENELGCYAEFVAINSDSAIDLKPKNLTFEESVSLIFGGHTALHFLKKAEIKAGQEILIYGASGSVGVSAVQLAKFYGAKVTTITSQKNTDLMKNLGANITLDYNSKITQKYDIVYDTVGKVAVKTIANLTKENKILILGGAIIKGALQGLWFSKTNKIKLIIGTAEVTNLDIQFLKKLAESGDLKPVIDRVYNLEEIQEAHKYVDLGHKVGNVIIKI